jgi:putative flippase GtrA
MSIYSFQLYEIIRYGVNGVVATFAHFGVLTFNLNVLNFASAGLANLVASMFGIIISFLGSRYFVFAKTGDNIITQVIKFGGLYSVIALCHGVVLLVWSDWWMLDYKLGFLIATAVQVSLSYIGNKFLVFKK